MDKRKDYVVELPNEKHHANSPDYKELIVEMVQKIENRNILKKIYTVAKTYYDLMAK